MKSLLQFLANGEEIFLIYFDILLILSGSFLQNIIRIYKYIAAKRQIQKYKCREYNLNSQYEQRTRRVTPFFSSPFLPNWKLRR